MESCVHGQEILEKKLHGSYVEFTRCRRLIVCSHFPVWKGILSATAFAVQSTFHTTLQQTPGQLVFGRDMIFNIKHKANWEYEVRQTYAVLD